MPECQHAEFVANVTVSRNDDGYIAEFVVSCKDCGRPFRFKQASEVGNKLRCPIEIAPLRPRLVVHRGHN